MTLSLRHTVLLIALLLGAQLAQASHVHADALPSHADCASCHLHADTLLPPAPLAPLPPLPAHDAIAQPPAAAPLLPRHSTRNRGPPAFA